MESHGITQNNRQIINSRQWNHLESLGIIWNCQNHSESLESSELPKSLESFEISQNQCGVIWIHWESRWNHSEQEENSWFQTMESSGITQNPWNLGITESAVSPLGFSPWTLIWIASIEDLKCINRFHSQNPMANLSLLVMLQNSLLPKFNNTNFWKWHSMNYNALLQMRLL